MIFYIQNKSQVSKTYVAHLFLWCNAIGMKSLINILFTYASCTNESNTEKISHPSFSICETDYIKLNCFH